MKGKDFIEKMQELDEDMIVEAAEPERRKGINYNFIKFAGVAACILVLVGASVWQSVLKNNGGSENFRSADIQTSKIMEETTSMEGNEETGGITDIDKDTHDKIAADNNETAAMEIKQTEAAEEETSQRNGVQVTPPDFNKNLTYSTDYYVEIEGKYYYSTGRESDITGRCCLMDGSVILVNSPYSNLFDFQYVNEDEVDVSINNVWVRFKAEDKAGYTMTLVLDEESLTNEGAEFDLLICGAEGTSGEEYHIERWENEKWTECEWKEGFGWNEVAWVLEDGKKRHFAVNWVNGYGALDAGQYRIRKNISTTYGNQAVYCEFEIGD